MSQKEKSQAPSRYLVKLSCQLFSEPLLRDEFIDSVQSGKCAARATLWFEAPPAELPFVALKPLPSQPQFIVRAAPGERPGKSDLHEKGTYYVFDYASVLMCLPLMQVSAASVLDMCASPGGKTLFAWKAMQPQKIYSNEVVGKRHAALRSNLKRCHIPAEATSHDPEAWAQSHPESFDLVIVDAPCSGQSLPAKGEKAPGCFHPTNVNSCMKRQRRIIANSSQCVVTGGHLLYSTCTYAPEENEELIDWFLEKFPDFKAVKVPALERFQSRLTKNECYRFFPDAEYGAGGFTCLLQRKGLQ